MTDITDIRGFHAHVYFDDATREVAVGIHDALSRRRGLELGALHEGPIGPHTKAMFQVAFAAEQFSTFVPWLMLNRGGLSVFVHPETDDPVADHDTSPLWMGDVLPLDIEFVRRVASA
jgi:DOPA 4,5-dioxygenase